MSKCKSCGKEIIWIHTQKGKSIPCDPDQEIYWQRKGGSHRIVTPNGEVVSAELSGAYHEATGTGYIPHFATCPDADKFRRKS